MSESMTEFKKQLGIYIHIPFCVSKCHYCDFLSAPADEKFQERYKDALIGHINKWASDNLFYLHEYQVKSVFFGGGTPSVINELWIKEILDTLREHFSFDKNPEITIECNPGTVTKHKLSVYRESGINRISFGLQTPEDELLRMIGRIHTWEEFEAGFKLARECGFDNINVDMMSALPGQTLDGYIEGLVKVIELEPEHISSYSLILEEGTRLMDNLKDYPPLPDEDTEREMYYKTKEILSSHGYERYEISNYSKSGMECIHNLSYWERTDYLGFGIGAASLFREERFSVISDVNEYINNINRGLDVIAEKELICKEEQMSEFMYLGLRKVKGISFELFEKNFSKKCMDVFGEGIMSGIREGLIVIEDDKCRLTDKGIDVSNYVLSRFV